MKNVIVKNNLKAIAIHLCMCAISYPIFIDGLPSQGIWGILLPTIFFMLYFLASWKFITNTRRNVTNALSIMSICIALPLFSFIVSNTDMAYTELAFLLLLPVLVFVVSLEAIFFSDAEWQHMLLVSSVVPLLSMWAGLSIKKRREVE